MSFEAYPAIDLRQGKVVRLYQGDYLRQTDYADDPLPLIEAYAAAGARWLHLVDLDAARDGGHATGKLLASIKRSTGLHVQVGGGVRQFDDVQRRLDDGADRVVVGTLAVEQPERVAELIQRFGPDHITVALDVRQDAAGVWRAPGHGWTADQARGLAQLCSVLSLSGLRHVLSTDIGRDGTLGGPNLELYRWLRACEPQWSVQASGGVRSLDDLRALRAEGLSAAVLGRVLLEGLVSVEEAMQC
ncbi:MAG: 1-(5-phosphoribosyl)-5-[(5-phosphoribosylamino)methylideneamino] imidazole-4-carboxamide isomerase [Xanthomonadales bacterium]|nr:1-(5-phosphoribosyl)-5-[(5-phosphoribosylamino)methylideneamino] imidazole-4-carboxamide isomerase [Xanthomonadales bacterium]